MKITNFEKFWRYLILFRNARRIIKKSVVKYIGYLNDSRGDKQNSEVKC